MLQCVAVCCSVLHKEYPFAKNLQTLHARRDVHQMELALQIRYQKRSGEGRTHWWTCCPTPTQYMYTFTRIHLCPRVDSEEIGHEIVTTSRVFWVPTSDRQTYDTNQTSEWVVTNECHSCQTRRSCHERVLRHKSKIDGARGGSLKGPCSQFLQEAMLYRIFQREKISRPITAHLVVYYDST